MLRGKSEIGREGRRQCIGTCSLIPQPLKRRTYSLVIQTIPLCNAGCMYCINIIIGSAAEWNGLVQGLHGHGLTMTTFTYLQCTHNSNAYWYNIVYMHVHMYRPKLISKPRSWLKHRPSQKPMHRHSNSLGNGKKRSLQM